MVIDSSMRDDSSDSGPQPGLCSLCGRSFTPPQPSSDPSSDPTTTTTAGQCPTCERTLLNGRPQRATQRRIHLEPRACNICHKTFISSAHLKLHLASHGKERKYRCSICSKYFQQNSHLVAHKLVHTGERPFKCPECGKCFGRASHLKTHRRIHSGEKPFVCTFCGKSFTQKGGLVAHALRHTSKRQPAPSNQSQRAQPPSGPDDLKCGVCCRTFVRSSYYRLRRRLRKGYRPYHCRVCNKTFAKLESFGNHCDRHLRLKKEKGKKMEERGGALSPQSCSKESTPEIKTKAKIKMEPS